MKKVYLLVIAMLATLWVSAEIVQGTVRSNGLDFNNDGTCEFSWTYNNTYLTYDYNSQTNIWGDDEEWDAPKPLAEGTSIGSSANWSGYGDCSIVGFGETPAIPVGQDVYLGFRIEYSDGLHYGWARVSVAGSNYEYTANWQAIYYETTPNTSINAGSVGSVTPPTPATYTITATYGEHGSISPAGTQTYNEGQTASYTISPDNGYEIDDVLVDGQSVINDIASYTVIGASASYTFNSIVANHTIHATFRMITSIDESVENSLMIYSENLMVIVRHEDGAKVAIYNIKGEMIASETLNGGELRFAMPSAGMYIVRVGSQVKKIVVTEW